MATPKPTKPQPPKRGKGKPSKKKQYKVRNWREYNQALVNRGSVLFWLTEEAIRQWYEEGRTGKPGRPKSYSDTAITAALTIQQVFRMPLRQTEGLLAGILERLFVPINAPDYSTLSVREQTLTVAIRVRPVRDEPLHIVVDSTGVKVYGEGEWKVRQHGWSKRRTWKKLHIGIDEATGDILLGAVTGNERADCTMLAPLLDEVPDTTVIDQVSGDGGYDRRRCYDTLQARHVTHIAIPPQINARIWKHGNAGGDPLPRDANLRRIRAVGRKRWKQECGYHRRSLIETTMFRLKTIFGDRVSSRTMSGQRTQLLLRCRALNLMTTLEMPKSYAVA